MTNRTLAIGAVAVALVTGFAAPSIANQTVSGSGVNTSGDPATGLLTLRENGSVVISITEAGHVCTSVIREPADKARGDMACSDGHNGHLVLRLHDDSRPKAIAYFRGANGSGTINFRN